MPSVKNPLEEAVYPAEELAKYNLIGSSGQVRMHDPANTDNGSVVTMKRKVKHKIHPNNKSKTHIRRQISGCSWNLSRWYAFIHWKNLFVVVVVPLFGMMLGVMLRPAIWRNTMYFTLWNYIITMISINIYYHRYLSHHSFDFKHDHLPIALAVVSCGAGITSAKNWCSSHRVHHRYCDVTDADPHNIRKGVLFSHYGWMILKHSKKISNVIRECKLDTLPNERIVKWQYNYYMLLFLFAGLIFPCLFCGLLWGDYLGGLIYGGILKIFLVQNSIFSINSLGHLLGSQPYNNNKSNRNNFILGIITLGEGNQNFHHEFPMDYRNGYEWYSFDPTKWTIRLLELFGQVTNIKKAQQNTIEKSLIQQQQRLLDDIRSQLNWGIPIDKLPVFSPEEFKALSLNSKNRYLVVVSGIIHDVTPFAQDHPGGLSLIRASHGKDATTAFNGAVYQHSNAAHNLLATMRIGKIGGCESLYWRQQRIENKNVPLDNDSEGKRIVRIGGQETSFGQLGSTAGAA